MPNRLAAESSPYLLQHANNPVDWHPWSDEALTKAKVEDKPIFLSIGYAACHWCHVMEHESFENPAIAEFLNRHFISIKVDREERPDLDQIYMQAVMALRGGQGGWPLSAFLTPEQEVFFGGTYWPPAPRHGLPGFDHVLAQVANAFRERRSAVVAHARLVSDHLRQSLAATGSSGDPDEGILVGAARLLEQHFDFQFGGFGGAPKFPQPTNVSLILRLWSRWPTGESPTADRLRSMVERNLSGMAQGGIWDHLGGGFARYSVDDRWLVPHFEKMLYDNALLASLYVDAWRLWGSESHAEIAQRTLNYLLRDMRDAGGGFHSSEDADSEGEEGKYYVWSRDEILGELGSDGPRFCELYGVTESGNFEGRNILHLPQTLETFADDRGLDPSRVRDMDRRARDQLLAVRVRRPRPGRDDKVLVNWNALAIEAFANAAAAFHSEDYFAAATRCADFIWNSMRDSTGRLLRVHRQGLSKQAAFLDDYAYLIQAFVTLYQAGCDSRWLDRAVELLQYLIDDFADPDKGGFFYTSSRSPSPITRWKEQHDSSLPSGNATAAIVLLRLGLICQQPSWLDLARQTIAHSLSRLHESPTANPQMLTAAEMLLDRRLLVVLVAPPGDASVSSTLGRCRSRWSPHLEFVWLSSDSDTVPSLRNTARGKSAIGGEITAYICQGLVCRAPISGRAAIESALDALVAERHRIGNARVSADNRASSPGTTIV